MSSPFLYWELGRLIRCYLQYKRPLLKTQAPGDGDARRSQFLSQGNRKGLPNRRGRTRHPGQGNRKGLPYHTAERPAKMLRIW